MTKLPQFSLAFFHPRYWLSWTGIAALWCIVQLPYPLLLRIGHGLGRLAMRLLPVVWTSLAATLSSVFPT